MKTFGWWLVILNILVGLRVLGGDPTGAVNFVVAGILFWHLRDAKKREHSNDIG